MRNSTLRSATILITLKRNISSLNLTMDLENLLLSEHSKRQTNKIVLFVGSDQKKFDQLISFCFGSDALLAQRASWPVSYCVEKHPEFARKHLRKILKQLRLPGHNAIRRNFTKLMMYIKIPKSLEAKTISVCFDLLNKKDEFVAVKVFSMAILAGFYKQYPEIREELKASIESQFSFETAGFRSRGRKVLKLINNNLSKGMF
jgi:hypothetical protein